MVILEIKGSCDGNVISLIILTIVDVTAYHLTRLSQPCDNLVVVRSPYNSSMLTKFVYMNNIII